MPDISKKVFAVVRKAQNMSRDDAIQYINRKINKAVRYVRESKDYWQRPSETMKRGAGDCEDIQLLKWWCLGLLRIKSGFMLMIGHAIGDVRGKYKFCMFDDEPKKCRLILDNKTNTAHPYSMTRYYKEPYLNRLDYYDTKGMIQYKTHKMIHGSRK